MALLHQWHMIPENYIHNLSLFFDTNTQNCQYRDILLISRSGLSVTVDNDSHVTVMHRYFIGKHKVTL